MTLCRPALYRSFNLTKTLKSSVTSRVDHFGSIISAIIFVGGFPPVLGDHFGAIILSIILVGRLLAILGDHFGAIILPIIFGRSFWRDHFASIILAGDHFSGKLL